MRGEKEGREKWREAGREERGKGETERRAAGRRDLGQARLGRVRSTCPSGRDLGDQALTNDLFLLPLNSQIPRNLPRKWGERRGCEVGPRGARVSPSIPRGPPLDASLASLVLS